MVTLGNVLQSLMVLLQTSTAAETRHPKPCHRTSSVLGLKAPPPRSVSHGTRTFRQEAHLHDGLSTTFTGHAASALDIEGEATGPVTECTGFLRLRKQACARHPKRPSRSARHRTRASCPGGVASDLDDARDGFDALKSCAPPYARRPASASRTAGTSSPCTSDDFAPHRRHPSRQLRASPAAKRPRQPAGCCAVAPPQPQAAHILPAFGHPPQRGRGGRASKRPVGESSRAARRAGVSLGHNMAPRGDRLPAPDRSPGQPGESCQHRAPPQGGHCHDGGSRRSASINRALSRAWSPMVGSSRT